MSSTTTHLPTRLRRRSGGGSQRRGLGARAGALLLRVRLDRMLAEGVPPTLSPALRLRAQQITSLSHRRKLADSFEAILDACERPAPRRTSAVPTVRREVRASRAAILDLCHELRARPHVAPAGVALAQQLLTDGTGPLYLESHNDALWHAVRRAAAALDGAG